MMIFSPISVSAALAASLALVAVLRPHFGPPTDSASPPPAQKDDVLRGPKVPPKGIESKRQFTGGQGGQRPAASGGSRPTIEQNAFFVALESMKFEGELKDAVEGARAEFLERVKQWEATVGEQRKKLFEQRKNAPSNQPPSEEFKKKMADIEASRPKLGELQQRVFGMLTEEQGAKLKDAFDAELKRVREEMSRKAEEDRKRREADRNADRNADRKGAPSDAKPKDRAPAKEKDAAKPKENGGGDGTGKPPADEPMQPNP